VAIFRVAILFVLIAASAVSASITWTLDATLADGATVTGSFVFDPNLGPNQTTTNFNINISAATPGTLSEPGVTLPTSVFFPFDFTPANSTARGPLLGQDGSFEFFSDTQFPNPRSGFPSANLRFDFVPALPISNGSTTIINNSNISVNDPYSSECFNCAPYVCFAGATSPVCLASTFTPSPEPREFLLVAFGICAFCCASIIGRRRDRLERTHFSVDDAKVSCRQQPFPEAIPNSLNG
jgi:hypothetical protein